MCPTQYPSLLDATDIDPAETYEQIRAAGNVVWDSKLKAWLVSSYDLVRQMNQMAGKDKGLWRSVLVWTESMPVMGLDEQTWIKVEGGGSTKHMFLIEGDEHERMHRWWLNTLQARTLARWEDAVIRPVAHAMIDRVAAAGRAELVTAYADPVAARVILAIMGLPWHDDSFVAKVIELPNRNIQLLQRQTERELDPVILDQAIAAMDELIDLVMPYVRERKDGQGDDFISLIWRDAAKIFPAGYHPTERDIVVQAVTAFIAAAETTASTAASGFYLLMTQPGLMATVRAGGRPAIRAFIEETLRLYAPVTHRPRIAMRDTELGGVKIRKDDMVVAVLNAGSRDPAHYPEPAQVNLERKTPHDHFAFSRGERVCPGQHLARLELQVILEVALERLGELRLDPSKAPPMHQGFLVRRWAPLHVQFAASVQD
jgi:cytochrome P450